MQRARNALKTMVRQSLSLPLACALGLLLTSVAAAQSASSQVIFLDQARSQAQQTIAHDSREALQA
jgi:hypothetical protein